MADARGKQTPSPAPDDDILELTEIVSAPEGEAETLIELPAELKELDSLDFKSLLGDDEAAPAETAPAPEAAPAVDLEAALTEESAPEALGDREPAAEADDSLTAVVDSHTVADIVAQVMENFDEPRLRQIIEPLLQEIAERLCRELFPGIAETVITREIEALKEGTADDG